jgi:hypothetical protein
MSTLSKKAKALVDYFSGRYECFVAETEDQIAELQAIRSEVFGDELQRFGEAGSTAIALEDEFDTVSLHLGCRDRQTEQIIGSVRAVPAKALMDKPDDMSEYHLHLFPEHLLDNLIVCSRLAFRKSYRRTFAARELITFLYGAVMDSGFVIASIVCEPNLFPLYRRFGFRPLSGVFSSPYGGYRLPLILICHDYEYLEKTNSPFLKVAKKRKYVFRSEGIDFYNSLASSGIDSGIIFDLEKSDIYHSALTRNMTGEGIQQLIHNSVLIKSHFGDQILKQDVPGVNMGVVKRGALEIRIGGRVIAILGEGDVFGEMAMILNTPRTADVIAANDHTEVILLSPSSVNRLKNKNDQIHIWRNLATICAKRLTMLNVSQTRETFNVAGDSNEL